MKSSRKVRLLFLCTGNSARSILGEYLLRHLAPHRFVTASAGSRPTGQVHPLALEVLRDRFGIEGREATSKSVESLAGEAFDFVITVCDHARDSCPIFPGGATLVHWGLPDPAAVTRPESLRRTAFEATADALYRSLEGLTRLPVETMEPAALEQGMLRLAPTRSAEEES